MKTNSPRANDLLLVFCEWGCGTRMLEKGRVDMELFSVLSSWGSFSYRSSVKNNLRFQQLVSHIHSRVYFIILYFYCYCCFVTRRAAVVSSMLHLCRPCEPLLCEVGRKEKDTFETKTK